jgi:folate-binding protein YgfZ
MPEVDCELYKLITVEGTDAVDFLQGQLTQDLGLLAEAGQLPAAWCNPKGRVIVTMRLIQQGETIGLIVPDNMADRVIQRLNMYRLRSKVDISTPSDDWKDLIAAGEADPTALIRSGIATIDETNSEAYTPHMLNLDKLGFLSFTKGCYTGQEIVARTEHLGKSKRRLMRYEADKEGIKVGDKLIDDERTVGEVVNVIGRDLLAVTPVGFHGQPLKLGDTTVSPKGVPYDL